jgi:hypothetical protein
MCADDSSEDEDWVSPAKLGGGERDLWVMLYVALKMVFARTVLIWGGMVYVADELLEVGKVVMKEVGL